MIIYFEDKEEETELSGDHQSQDRSSAPHSWTYFESQGVCRHTVCVSSFHSHNNPIKYVMLFSFYLRFYFSIEMKLTDHIVLVLGVQHNDLVYVDTAK